MYRKILLTLFSVLCLSPLCAQQPDADSLLSRIRELSAQEQLWRSRIHDVRTEIQALQGAAKSESSEVSLLRGRIAALIAFAPEKERNRVLSSASYLERPLSTLRPDSLLWMADVLRPYSRDAEVAALWQRLQSVTDYKRKYDEAYNVLCRPLDIAARAKARSWCGSMKGAKHLSAGQWTEIDTLDIFLSRYPYGLDQFALLINDLNAKLQSLREQDDTAELHSKALSVVEEVLRAHAPELERRIPYIPYLRNLFSRYAELLREPLLANEERDRLEEEILNTPRR